MSSDFASNKALFKSVIAGVSAGAMIKLIQKENASMNQCVIFSGVVGAGVFVSTLIEGSYPNFQGDGMSQFTLKLGTDVALTSGAVYGASMFSKALLPEFSLSTVGVIVASDLIGEAGSMY